MQENPQPKADPEAKTAPANTPVPAAQPQRKLNRQELRNEIGRLKRQMRPAPRTPKDAYAKKVKARKVQRASRKRNRRAAW